MPQAPPTGSGFFIEIWSANMTIDRQLGGKGADLRMLRELAAETPEMSVTEVIFARGLGFGEAVIRHFGSIEDGAQTAGLTDWPQRLLGPVMTKRDVVRAIRRRRREGAGLQEFCVARKDACLWNSARRRFGSWKVAIKAASNKSLVEKRGSR